MVRIPDPHPRCNCLRIGEPLESGVYGGAALRAVHKLSERTIAAKSRTVDYPDFTRGKWIDRKPVGIVKA